MIDRKPATIDWAKVVVGTLGILFLLLVLLLYSCATGMCGNEVFQEAGSPDGKYRAVIFQRDCGATTGFSTQVSILSASATLGNKPGNVFIADGHPDWTRIEVQWDDARMLTITYLSENKISKSKTKYRGITVNYKEISP
jgi:hypothetical protein